MQKISCHCTLYLRLVCDMLCPFLWDADHRDVPSIYNQDQNRLWFLNDCYFRQLLYKSGCVLLENSGDKKSCKEHSKRMGWGREWIIAPLLEAKKWFPRCQYEGARVGMGMGSNVGALLGTLPSNVAQVRIQASITYMWVEFVVGSLPCFERFFSGCSGFPFSSKPILLKSNSICSAPSRLN